MTSNSRLLLLLASVTFGKYIYVGERMHWDRAQSYCRSKYTDLAPVSNQLDIDQFLKNENVNNLTWFWIGLLRNPENPEEWLWSGGGRVGKTFWRLREPNNNGGIEDRGLIIGDSGWNDAPMNFSLPFFCYKVHAVMERKTWYDALDHCRRNYRGLASVASETELMLMQKELRKGEIMESVWIGLSFLDGAWMWMDGQPLEYKPGVWEVNLGVLCSVQAVRSAGLETDPDAKGDLGWTNAAITKLFPFACYKVYVVSEKKTFEEAVDHCKRNHRNLASVASDTEMILMQTELRKSMIFENVWIGMRFLGDQWMWVDGQPLEYEAWGSGNQETAQQNQEAAQQNQATAQPNQATSQQNQETAQPNQATSQQNQEMAQQNQATAQPNQVVPGYLWLKRRHNRTKQRRSRTKRRHNRTKRRHNRTKRRHNRTKRRHNRTKQRRSRTKRRHNRTKRRHNRTKQRRSRTKRRQQKRLTSKCGMLRDVMRRQLMQWNQAQTVCRNNYTDLATISNKYDYNLVFDYIAAIRRVEFWIGLTRNPNNPAQWMWSGGGQLQVGKTFWVAGEPNNYGGMEDSGASYGDFGWNDVAHTKQRTFLCYKVHAVSEKKTFEEALEHCRRNHRDLASVASETELMLMLTEMKKLLTTLDVWIGMRFLADEWMWVDGQPLEYEAWGARETWVS
ncbi:hypothetical protein WMY93_022354 [Mugilogobius chulae]|uniref:C-type lectin domain-containing protein n=1 Tax=Mugilogobius chulae TaxID=88201 RepID=A0AAW0NGY5_9GOBI